MGANPTETPSKASLIFIVMSDINTSYIFIYIYYFFLPISSMPILSKSSVLIAISADIYLAKITHDGSFAL